MNLICYAIINIGRDTIKNKVDLNIISDNIVNLLKDDPKYLPLSNNLVSILSSYEENKQDFDTLIAAMENKLIQDTLIIHKDYSSAIEDINRSLKVAINKNEQEIKNIQESTEQDIKFLQNEITTSKKVYRESIELAKTKYSRVIFDAEDVYNDEINSIDNEAKDLRQRYRVELQKNDNDKTIKLNKAKDEFDIKVKEIEQKISNRRKAADREIEILTKDINELKKSTDETYLTIKTTHTQANIRFNEFVNKRKVVKDSNIELLKDTYENSLLPYEKQTLDIQKKYDINLDKAQNEYAEKLKALNVIFDVQKNVYNKKTAEIIAKNNKELSKINSNFSTLRDQIDNKKALANELHSGKLQKTSDENKRTILYRQYRKDIKKLNEQLAQEIINNQQLIAEQEIKLQLHLYNHDAKHIEQINKWRHSKNVYEYERNQHFLKVKHEYENEASKINLELKQLKTTLANNEAIESIKINKDLQPIETQLFIASLIQEREISLLNTENETYQNLFKIQQSLITNNFFKDELLLRQQLEIQTENHRYALAQINIKHQLEFEKMRQRRDHELHILKLNKTLQKSLLRQKKNIENIKLDATTYQENLNINNLDARLNYQTKLFRQKALMEFEKRQTIISEIKLKNQRLKISEKNKRTLLLAKADAEHQQKVNNLLFSEFYKNYELESNLNKIIKQLFKIPAHPEVFRKVFNNILEIFKFIKEYLTIINNYFVEVDKKLITKRIDNVTEYKYRIKHEELINLYSNNIEQVQNKRNELLKDNNYIQAQIRMLENKKILNDSLIANYRLDQSKAAKEKDHYAVMHARSQIKILRSENNLLRSKLKQSDRDIDRLKSKVNPLEKQVISFKNKQLRAEKDLNKKKFKEEVKYQRLLKKHKLLYKNFTNYIEKRFNSLSTIYIDLVNKTYISTDFFNTKSNKALKNQKKYNLVLNKYQQSFLSNWLELYNITKNDQNKVMNSFDKITNFSISKIRKMHSKFIESEKKEQLYLSKIYLDETKRNSDFIKRSVESSDLKIKSLQSKYRTNYTNTENLISQHNTKTNNSINIISENLKGVLEQLKNENTDNLLKIRRDLKKEENNMTAKIANQNKILKDIENRNTIRTNAIISRYERRKERRYKKMQNLIKKYTNDIANLNKDTKDKEIRMKAKIKQNQSELNKFRSNLDNTIKRYRITSKKEQNKITRKEKRTLKNSYKFKRKQIKAKNK